MKIGLLSDSHGWLHPSIAAYFNGCDEIWHAGDIGNIETAMALEAIKPLRAVYGNIDGNDIRSRFPRHLRFSAEEADIWITHIGGYPGRYAWSIKEEIRHNPPDLFICGHSHIVKVVFDKKFNMLTINPGAAGYNGFHKVMTIARFSILKGKVSDLEIIELGERAKHG